MIEQALLLIPSFDEELRQVKDDKDDLILKFTAVEVEVSNDEAKRFCTLLKAKIYELTTDKPAIKTEVPIED